MAAIYRTSKKVVDNGRDGTFLWNSKKFSRTLIFRFFQPKRKKNGFPTKKQRREQIKRKQKGLVTDQLLGLSNFMDIIHQAQFWADVSHIFSKATKIDWERGNFFSDFFFTRFSLVLHLFWLVLIRLPFTSNKFQPIFLKKV